MKKILFFLFFLLLVNLNYTFASNFKDIDNNTQLSDAIDLLNGYNIINGYPNDNFQPENFVTRAEMAKMLTIVLGYYEYTQNMHSNFNDTSGHWAENYVELANALGIIKGTSENTYEPDKKISFAESYTMILRLLGYTDNSLIGEWPSNYYKKAVDIGLFKNIDINKTYATRENVAIMLYNALDINMVSVNNKNNIVSLEKPLLSLLGKVSSSYIDMNYLKYESFDFSDFIFSTCNIYYDNQGTIRYVKREKSKIFYGSITGLLENDVAFVSDDYGNTRAIKLSNIPIVFNGSIGNIQSLEGADVKIVYENDLWNSNIIGIIANKITDSKIVSKDDLYNTETKTLSKKFLPLKSNSEINFSKLYITGDVEYLNDIQKNDLVYFYETIEDNKNSCLRIHVVRNQISGTISNISSDSYKKYYTINNKTYETINNLVVKENPSINDTVFLILDENGYIIFLDIIRYGKIPSTYGIVLSSSNSVDGYSNARILDSSGVLKTYNLANNSKVVNKVEKENTIEYISTLTKNSIVKFDPMENTPVKIIDLMPSILIKSSLNTNTLKLSNGYQITYNSFLIYESNGKYEILKPSQLDSYIEGKAVINSNGTIDAMILSKGIKTNSKDSDTQKNTSTESVYSGTFYDIVKEVNITDKKANSIKFFVNNDNFSISSNVKIDHTFLNSYVKVTVSNGVITSISKVSAETDKIQISAVYSNQLQIDGLTYIEYSSDTKVFICTTDSSGNYINIKNGSKADIKSGSKAQLYDVYGNFDGIIDVIFIFK